MFWGKPILFRRKVILILRVKPIRMFSWRLAFLAYCEIIVACKLVGGEGWVGGRRWMVVVAGGGGFDFYYKFINAKLRCSLFFRFF